MDVYSLGNPRLTAELRPLTLAQIAARCTEILQARTPFPLTPDNI